MTQNNICPVEVLRFLLALEVSVLPANIQITKQKRLLPWKEDMLRNTTFVRGEFRLSLLA